MSLNRRLGKGLTAKQKAKVGGKGGKVTKPSEEALEMMAESKKRFEEGDVHYVLSPEDLKSNGKASRRYNLRKLNS